MATQKVIGIHRKIYYMQLQAIKSWKSIKKSQGTVGHNIVLLNATKMPLKLCNSLSKTSILLYFSILKSFTLEWQDAESRVTKTCYLYFRDVMLYVIFPYNFFWYLPSFPFDIYCWHGLFALFICWLYTSVWHTHINL